MAVLYFLVPLALILAGSGTLAFIWASKNGQFEDVDTPAIRILIEDNVEQKIDQDHGNQKGS